MHFSIAIFSYNNKVSSCYLVLLYTVYDKLGTLSIDNETDDQTMTLCNQGRLGQGFVFGGENEV